MGQSIKNGPSKVCGRQLLVHSLILCPRLSEKVHLQLGKTTCSSVCVLQ